jgi:hypothetical protein
LPRKGIKSREIFHFSFFIFHFFLIFAPAFAKKLRTNLLRGWVPETQGQIAGRYYSRMNGKPTAVTLGGKQENSATEL